MGMFDVLKGSAAKAAMAATGMDAAGATTAEVNAVSKLLGAGGADFGALLEKFKTGGLGDIAASWVGKGENKSLGLDQVKAAFKPEQIAAVAKELGVSQEVAVQKVAQILPSLIDKLTPDGLVPNPEAIASKLTALLGK